MDTLKKHTRLPSVQGMGACPPLLPPEGKDGHHGGPFLSSRRPWARLGCLWALTGYIGQIACQALITSSFWLAQASPSGAMEDQKDKIVLKRKRSEGAAGSPRPKRLALGLMPGNTGFYQDAGHPLTNEFWKGRDLSGRLREIKADITELKEQIINCKADTVKPYLEKYKDYLEKYKDLFKYVECENDLSQYLVHINNNQQIDFDLTNIKEGSGCDLSILSRDKTNLIAIKKFNNIEEGLKELLYSLIALDINPSPQELKMARIYDAVIYPENCLNLIMEGANTHVAHHFLSTDLSGNVIKACAEYLAMFHIKNHLKPNKNINRENYIRHAAQSFRTLIDNPLKGENEKIKLLCLPTGKKWDVNDLEKIESDNIIRTLSVQEQEECAFFVKGSYENFRKNSGEILRSLEARDDEREKEYFLTITHGDAHGNNFLYNDDEKLKLNDYKISKDSFYRITMTDVGSIIKTYGDTGDPAEDVGRFLGSLCDWVFQQNYPEPESHEKIENFQNLFIRLYLKKITEGHIFKETSNQKNFEKMFSENYNYYKLRFYRAIFNSPEKSSDIKIKILRSWTRENAGLAGPSQGISQPHALKEGSEDRPWKPAPPTRKQVADYWFLKEMFPLGTVKKYVSSSWGHNGDVVRWLPGRPAGFVESTAEGSNTSYLTRLWEELHSTGSATLSSRAAIAGMGGIGKTSLALEYAHEALDHKAYDLIYWLLSEKEASLLDGYRNLLRDMGVPAKGKDDNGIIALVQQHVPEKGKCLLIYDNVPDAEFLKGKAPSGADILVTSRCREGWGKDPLSLDVFRPGDAIKYLVGITGLEASPDNQDKAGKLAEALGYFPLALSHAAHYIKLVRGRSVSGDSFETYLQDFRRAPAVHFEERQDPFKAGELEMTYENLVGKTYSLSSRHISELAKKIMAYCSYLDPDSIAEGIFLEGWDNREDLREAFAQLSALSLINRIQDAPLFSIHRLVQLVVRNEQERPGINQQNKELLPGICFLFNESFKNNIGSAEQIDRLIINGLPHIVTLFGHAKRLKVSSREVGALGWVGKVLWVIGSMNEIGKPSGLSRENRALKQEGESDTKKMRQLLEKALGTFEGPVSGDVPGWLREIAAKGHPAVQTALGVMYDQNIFVNEDGRKAVSLYAKAANQGFALAQCNLGNMYAQGRGVEQSDGQAVEWWAKAANQGYAPAQFILGVMYDQGRGVEQSDGQAVKWHAKAAKQGNPEAQFNLGVIYEEGRGVEQSDGQAAAWYAKAAKQGYYLAQCNLGVMFYQGRGVEQSDGQAVEWLAKAANQGDARAENNLGYLCEMQRNYGEAIRYYTMASSQNHGFSFCNLGHLYQNGIGVEKNEAVAAEYFEKGKNALEDWKRARNF